MENLISIFVGVATELREDLEKALLQLEKDKQNKQGISEAFRIMHSLKGAANMFGFEAINNLTHNLETIYQAIRDDGANLTNEIFNTTLACLDHLKALLENPKMDDPELQKVHANLIKEINRLSDGITKNPSEKKVEIISSASEATYYIYFKPA